MSKNTTAAAAFDTFEHDDVGYPGHTHGRPYVDSVGRSTWKQAIVVRKAIPIRSSPSGFYVGHFAPISFQVLALNQTLVC